MPGAREPTTQGVGVSLHTRRTRTFRIGGQVIKCKNCSGQLVLQETNEYSLDENGVYDHQNRELSRRSAVVCTSCRAIHTYDLIHTAGDKGTIALAVNSDPLPHSALAIGLRDGQIENIRSLDLLGLIIVDESLNQVACVLTKESEGEDMWLTRAERLAALIPKHEWKAGFPDDA